MVAYVHLDGGFWYQISINEAISVFIVFGSPKA